MAPPLQRTFLRSNEIYFTLHRAETDDYTLILSYLPPLADLLRLLPPERFTGKYLVFYFGLHSSLTYDQLSQAGIAFESIPFEHHSLCVLQFSPEQRDKFLQMTLEYRDWWCLTQAAKPTAENLKSLGVVANPSALSLKNPSLYGEILLNYFTDPSYHGFAEKDFLTLTESLFRHAFGVLYGPAAETLPFVKALHLKTHLGVDWEEGRATAREAVMQSFRLRGGRRPCIEKIDWSSQRRERLCWGKSRWSELRPMRSGAVAAFFEVARQYLTPLLLVPIALVVIPVTLLLWPFIAILRQILRAKEQ